MARDKLNAREEMFAQEIADGLSNADAYRIVYGQGKRTDETLYSDASRKRRKVDARVTEILRERAQSSRPEKERCKQVLMNIVNSNPKKTSFTDPKTGKNKMRSPQQLADSTADAIKTMTNSAGVVSYTFEGKIEAIRELAKLNGWYEPEEHTHHVEGEFRKVISIGGLSKNDDSEL